MKISTFLKNLFTINRSQENPIRIIGSGVCMAIPLLIGYFFNNLTISSFGSLGIFPLLYYQDLPRKQLLRRLGIVGCSLLSGVMVGMFSTHTPWTIPFAISGVAFGARILFRLYGIAKPGGFFIIMVTAMGTAMKIPLAKIPIMIGFVSIGVLTSLVIATLLSFYLQRHAVPMVSQKKMSLQERLYVDPAALLDALHYAVILFLATYISQSLHLTNSYWMIVSCAAVLQGENLRAVMHRNLQRIFGTMVGLLISALLLNIALSPLQTIGLICLLFMTVEFSVKRNYAIANFFTTPMALLLSNLARHQYISSLLSYRLLGIVLGSLLGLASAYVLTTSVKFYNRAYQLNVNFDKEVE
ncbi:FUSC family protein [Enterococcus faecalis]